MFGTYFDIGTFNIILSTLSDFVISPKASVMHYWKEPRQTLKEAPMRYSMDDDPNLFFKPGPGRKLKLELELSRLDGVSIKTSVQSIMQRTCGYNFLKHRGRFSFITCFAGHTIR
jgi:hypothetical protein